jgi:ATP-binding cassette, subfamily B, bacterial
MKLFRSFVSRRACSVLSEISRAMDYFTEDRRSLYVLFILSIFSTLVGLLQAWPLAVLIDSLIDSRPVNDWVHRWFLAPFPNGPLFEIVGLAVVALGLRLFQEVLNAARKLLRSRIEYNGLLRVRYDMFRKMQAMHLGFHRSQPLGDSIFRLTTDTFGCAMILVVLMVSDSPW